MFNMGMFMDDCLESDRNAEKNSRSCEGARPRGERATAESEAGPRLARDGPS